MDFFGLDIGTSTTKIIQLKKTGKEKYWLKSAVIMQTPSGGMAGDSEANLVAMAETIKKGMNEAKINTKHVVGSLPEAEVFTRIVPMPKMSKSELESAISWEAEQNIPLPMADVNFSYQVVNTKEDGSMEVMIIAAPKRLVEKFESMFALAELVPVALETNLVAASRALTHSEQTAPAIIIIIGFRSTEIGITKAGNLVFTRSIATAGESLTRALVTGLQLETAQAESYKRSYGINTEQLEGKVAASLQPIIGILNREIKRTINYYQTQAPDQTIKTAILTGGSANLPQLVPLLTKELNIEVQIGSPLQKLDTGKETAISTELLPSYAIAMGLAMKEL